MLYHFWIRILSDRVPVCAATSFFRSPMVSSSLHFTLTFFPSRSFSTTSIIFARLNLNLRFPNPNYSLSHAFTNFLRNPLFDWKSTENFSPYIYIYILIFLIRHGTSPSEFPFIPMNSTIPSVPGYFCHLVVQVGRKIKGSCWACNN